MKVIRALLVEDDKDDRDLFEYFYTGRPDISMMPPLSNGEELVTWLNQLSSPDFLPDLIILDFNMPKMNGQRALEILKSDARFGHIPVMIYTTRCGPNLVASCSRLGAELVVEKPIDFEGYQKMMDEFLHAIATRRPFLTGS